MSDTLLARPTHRATARPDRARLFEIASEQGGYFTAEQARTSGYSWALLSHHAKSGQFLRVRRGLHARHPADEAEGDREPAAVARGQVARLLRRAEDVGGQVLGGDQRRREVDVAVEGRAAAPGDRVVARGQAEVVGRETAVGDADVADVARKVQDLQKRIIYLTGYAGADRLPAELRAHPCLAKPVQAPELVAIMRNGS